MAEANSEGNSTLSAGEACLMKYLCLRRRCEQIQLNNERLVNRLQQMRKMIKKVKKERKFLMSKLDEHGDNYRDTLLSQVWQESQVFETAGTGVGDSASAIATTSAAHLPILPPDASTSESLSSPASIKSKKVKTEKEKDPNAPKKPANAFFMFCQQQRSAVQEAYLKEHDEEISHQELTKTLAMEWNNLLQEKKKVYYELYEKEKERYEQEMKEYTSSGRPEMKTSELTSDLIKSEPAKLA